MKYFSGMCQNIGSQNKLKNEICKKFSRRNIDDILD